MKYFDYTIGNHGRAMVVDTNDGISLGSVESSVGAVKIENSTRRQAVWVNQPDGSRSTIVNGITVVETRNGDNFSVTFFPITDDLRVAIENAAKTIPNRKRS